MGTAAPHTPAHASALRAAGQVITTFANMRRACPHYAGTGAEWDSRQCTKAGNNYQGSTCCMPCCPILRDQAAEAGMGWN